MVLIPLVPRPMGRVRLLRHAPHPPTTRRQESSHYLAKRPVPTHRQQHAGLRRQLPSQLDPSTRPRRRPHPQSMPIRNQPLRALPQAGHTNPPRPPLG